MMIARRSLNPALLLLVAALLLAGFGWWLRAPLHRLPLERDEGAYAIIAERWLAGDALYRQVFDHKPPLVYAVFALARLLPGDRVESIRVLATLYLLAVSGALLALGLQLYGRAAALGAALLLLVYGSSTRFQGLTFNTEAVMSLPALLGCLFAVRAVQSRRAALLLAAGAAVGLAAAAKPVGAALLLPLAGAALLLGPRRAAGLAWAAAGFLLPLLAFAAILWRQGALPAAYDALVSYNRLYAAESLARGWEIGALLGIWGPMLVLALPGLAGLALTALEPRGRTAAHAVAAAWGLALLATALLSLRAYPHYYLAAVPLFCLWAAAGIAELARRVARPVALIALGALLAAPLADIWPLRPLPPERQIAALYGADGELYFGPAARVAALIAAEVPPDRPIFVWAAEPELYYLARRRPAARYVYDYPVDRAPGARDELLAALRRDPPPLIVTYRAVRPIGFEPFMPEHGYRLLRTIDGYDLFSR